MRVRRGDGRQGPPLPAPGEGTRSAPPDQGPAADARGTPAMRPRLPPAAPPSSGGRRGRDPGARAGGGQEPLRGPPPARATTRPPPVGRRPRPSQRRTRRTSLACVPTRAPRAPVARRAGQETPRAPARHGEAPWCAHTGAWRTAHPRALWQRAVVTRDDAHGAGMTPSAPATGRTRRSLAPPTCASHRLPPRGAERQA